MQTVQWKTMEANIFFGLNKIRAYFVVKMNHNQRKNMSHHFYLNKNQNLVKKDVLQASEAKIVAELFVLN